MASLVVSSLASAFSEVSRAAAEWVRVWGLVCAAALVAVGALAGCVDLEQVRAERDRGEATISTLKSRASEYQTTLDGLPVDHPERGVLQAEVERAAAAREGIARRLRDLADLEARAREDGVRIGGQDVVEGVGGVGANVIVGGVDLVDLVPGPWKVAALLGVGLVTSLVRSKQLRDAATSMARSIDKALEEDAKLAARFRQHANTLRTIQTPLAKKIVDEGQRQKE